MTGILDGQTHVVDERMCREWKKSGKLRCSLCGHDFTPGDTFRFIMTNTRQCNDLGVPCGNPFVCAVCDGTNDEVYAMLIAAKKEWREISKKWWWFLQDVIAEAQQECENEARREARREAP